MAAYYCALSDIPFLQSGEEKVESTRLPTAALLELARNADKVDATYLPRTVHVDKINQYVEQLSERKLTNLLQVSSHIPMSHGVGHPWTPRH
jgi:hypothetical protein